ncbi:MAG: tetratricopeptide repeat protein [Bacteroidales bacterium]|nr:tetratricopeptide repeat protein [Bacteroidales bacterium]
MNYTELKEKYNQVFDDVSAHRIKETFSTLDLLVVECNNRDLSNNLDKHKETYRNILKYSFELSDDPEKEKVYKKLMRNILELTDDIREDIILSQRLLGYYKMKGEIVKSSQFISTKSGKLIDNLTFQKEIEGILADVNERAEEPPAIDMDTYKKYLVNIFRIIWLTDKFRENEITMVKQVINTRGLPWFDKSILVSALTLSLIRHFDLEKVNLMFDFLEAREHQIWQRSITGLILALLIHDKRLIYYPEIERRLQLVREHKNFNKNVEAIVIQYLKARETEKVTRKIREEIFPEMMKIKSTLEEKLDLGELLSEKGMDEKNPEWETVFEDSPGLYDKLEEFSTLQMEGSDVFLSAFAMLKRFPFFNELSNWFLPFYKENENITGALTGQDDGFDVSTFVEGMERSSILCNSDKYSFCLNVRHLPLLQKNMMMEMFNMEMEAMNELSSSDEMLDDTLKDRTIYTQYLQDLYRFFKLYPTRSEFEDIFETPFRIEESQLISILIEDQKILRNIAEFYFEKDYYQEAINIYESLSSEEDNFEIFEKVAFCYLKLQQYKKALDYFHRAELFDKNKNWLNKKIAFCYRKLDEPEKALRYYEEVESQDPENQFIQVSIGHTYMDMEDYDSALKYFFKVEYNNPKNFKVFRPLAWCSFVQGKFDQAKKYFNKVIEKEVNKNDLVNLGHVEWCSGEKKQAIEHYRNALIKSAGDFEWLTGVFEQDKKYLVQHGIMEFDIPLMIDYLKMVGE